MNYPLCESEFVLCQWGAVICASLVGAVADLRTRKIPNRLTLPFFVCGLAWAAAVGGLAGLCESLAACVLVALPFVLLFVMVSGGAGDAKLMAAIGAWLGLSDGVMTLLAVVVSGAICGLVYALWKGRIHTVWNHGKSVALGLLLLLSPLQSSGVALARSTGQEQMLPMPYGVAIFVGVCASAGGAHLWHTYE